MRSPSSSHKRVWMLGVVVGCGLLAIMLPLLWAQTTTQARQKGGGATDAGSNDRVAALKADVEAAVQQLENGKSVEFIEDYFPVNELRAIREQTSVSQAAHDPRLPNDIWKRFAKVLALCTKAKPTLSQGDGIAAFSIFLIPDKSTEKPKPPEVVKKATSAEPLPGFGADLDSALGKAVQLLKDKLVEDFVLGFFPLQEAQHLKSSGELADLLYVVQENPQMAAVMQRDLEAMQKAKPVLTTNDTIAEFKIKLGTGERGTKESERTIRLQLIEGHWRMFDFASPVRKQINEIAAKVADDSPEAIVVKWERFGNRWRLLSLDFIEP